MFVRGHDGQTIGIEVRESINGWGTAVERMREREETQEGAGGDVGVTFCLSLVFSVDASQPMDGMLTVRTMPFPARGL